MAGVGPLPATKAAIIMLTKSLGGALAPHGIHVNAIAPGNTATPPSTNAATRRMTR